MACGKDKFSSYLELKDYFLTMEDFLLMQCTNCGLLYTHPSPEPDQSIKYYDSKEYTSHTIQGCSLKNFLYRSARTISLRSKLKLIEKHKRGGRILDIGAGAGNFLNYCQLHGWAVMGAEVNGAARTNARNQFGLELYSSTDDAHVRSLRYDVITMWHVLEHMVDAEEQIIANKNLLTEEGIMVIALPDYESWDARYYGKFWAAYDVPRHLYHFSRRSIQLLSEKTGFMVIETKPLLLDAFYISLLSEKYSNKKLNYLYAFINGIRSNVSAARGRFSFSSRIYILKKK